MGRTQFQVRFRNREPLHHLHHGARPLPQGDIPTCLQKSQLKYPSAKSSGYGEAIPCTSLSLRDPGNPAMIGPADTTNEA
jgi:hypothetical protein